MTGQSHLRSRLGPLVLNPRREPEVVEALAQHLDQHDDELLSTGTVPVAVLSGRAVAVLTFHGLGDGQNPYDGKAAGRAAEWLESIPDALAGWARHNGCRPSVVFDDPPGPLWTMRYEGCRDDAEVRLVRIDALDHTWPRDEIDATGEIWRFLSRQIRR